MTIVYINDTVNDSILYKRTTEKYSKTFTYLISTDGAPLFNVFKREFWRLQIILNDLPTNLRFKFVLLAGIMIVKTKPKSQLIDLFIGELSKEAKLLHEEGISIKLVDENREMVL